MKQLLFLLLFPCLALAQYQGNANQKITLGEQTTADGLVFRGLASIDTVTATSKITRANKQDTSAFILLDTVTNLLWHYKTASNGWIQAGGGVSVSSFSAGTTGLTPSTATTGAVTLGGTLAVANGGTGSATQNFVDLTTTQSIGGAKTFTSAVVGASFRPESSTIPTNGIYLPNTNTLGFSTNGIQRIHIASSGNIGFGTNNPIQPFSFSASAALADFTSTTSTQFNGFEFKNGGGSFYIGQDNSTGTFYGGGVGYASSWYNSNSVPIIFYTNALQRMRVTENGEVWIGYTADNGAYRLQVQDSVYVGGNVSASAYTTRSDYDLKDEIQNISYGINEVMQMQPVKYTYKSNGSSQLGFIAQDLGVITPEVVSFEDKMSVYYNALIPILTKAIQEQQALIKALEQRILTLENK